MLINKLMGCGLPAALAQAFCGDIADDQTAAGTTQTDALTAGTGVVRCTTVGSGTGLRLYNGTKGDSQIIINDGANGLAVYPPVGHTIDNLAANAAFTIPPSSWAQFERVTNTRWVASNDSATTSFVQSGSGTVSEPLQDRLSRDVLITDFMTAAQKADALLASPTLDHASAMSAAIARVMGTQGSIATRGGAIRIPGGYRIRLATDPFGVLPNDGNASPSQVPIRIYGDVSDASATGTLNLKGASVIDFRYTTSNNAKIDTRGRGVFEIDNLVIADESGNDEPFIFTSNSVIKVHDNCFLGSKTSSWDQDCIILGGTDTVFGTAAADAPFQGYGSQIYNNHFHRIRRPVYAKVYANGVPVHHNTVWADCGFTTGACFEYDADPLGSSQFIAGVPLHHNLVEMGSYKYGAKFRRVVSSTIGPNDFFDADVHTTSHYTFGAGAQYNLVIGGYNVDTKPLVEETGDAVGTNTWLQSHLSQASQFTQPMTFAQATFTGGTGLTLLQPAASQSDASAIIQGKRSAAEASNAGAIIVQLLQSGTLTIGGSNAGNMTFQDAAGNPLCAFTSNGKTWSATASSGAGGNMKIDTGTGGSILTIVANQMLLKDQTGAQRLNLMHSKDGIFFGSAEDTNLYRSTSDTLKTDDSLVITGRLQGAQGVAVASASHLTVGADGNRFQITGTTQIDNLDNTNWQGGSIVTLHFQGSLTVTHNTAASNAFRSIMLSGAANFSATANDQLTLQYDGTDTKWYEIARTVI